MKVIPEKVMHTNLHMHVGLKMFVLFVNVPTLNKTFDFFF